MGNLKGMGISEYDTINKHEKLFRELDDLNYEINLEIAKGGKNKNYHCSNCQANLSKNELICNKKECLKKAQAEINQKLGQNSSITNESRGQRIAG